MKNAIFQDLTQSELDREYSPSSCVKSIDPYLTLYRAQTLQAHASLGKIASLDLQYGRSEAEKIDLFVQQKNCPLLVFIHGGYWQALDKHDAAFAAETWVDNGWGWAAINYALAPSVSFKEIVTQNIRALAWLLGQGQRYGYDPSRILLVGHSAGAHLAAMLMANEELGLRDHLCGAVLISGVYDLSPIRLSYVNEPLLLSDGDVDAFSPINLSPKTRCPVLLPWGANETNEFKRQSQAFSDVWAQQGVACKTLELPDKNHFDCILDLGVESSVLFTEIKQMIAR